MCKFINHSGFVSNQFPFSVFKMVILSSPFCFDPSDDDMMTNINYVCFECSYITFLIKLNFITGALFPYVSVYLLIYNVLFIYLFVLFTLFVHILFNLCILSFILNTLIFIFIFFIYFLISNKFLYLLNIVTGEIIV